MKNLKKAVALLLALALVLALCACAKTNSIPEGKTTVGVKNGETLGAGNTTFSVEVTDAEGAKIHGAGKADEIKANEQTTVAGKPVKPGTTTDLNASSGGSGSSGGGGGGGSTEPAVKYEMTASLNKASYDINESIVVTGGVTADGKAAANVPLCISSL